MNGLYAATTHQGSVYSASEAAIPFLCEILRRNDPDTDVYSAVWVLQRIAVGEEHFINEPEDVATARRPYCGAVCEHADLFLDRLATRPDLGLERLLAVLTPAAPRAHERLRNAWTAAGLSPEVRASHILALAMTSVWLRIRRRADTESLQRELEHSPHLLCRISAAIGLVWMLGPAAPTLAVSLLLHLTRKDARAWAAHWPWHTEVRDLVTRAYLRTLSDHDLVDRAGSPKSSLFAGEALRRLFASIDEPLLPCELDPLQRALLHSVVEHHPALLSNVYMPLPSLPRSAAGLRRLLGQDAGPLDRLVALAPYSSLGPIPLWFGFDAVDRGRVEPGVLTAAISECHDSAALRTLIEAAWQDEDLFRSSRPYPSDADASRRQVLILSILADAVLRDAGALSWLQDKSRAWVESVAELSGDDLAFKTKPTEIALCLLVAARWSRRRRQRLSPELEPLVQIYHEYPQFSRVALAIIAEALVVASPEHQRRIAAELALFKKTTLRAQFPDHGDQPELLLEIETIEPTSVWCLVAVCRGDWVAPKVLDAMRAWWRVERQDTDSQAYRLLVGRGHARVCRPLPRALAVQALARQGPGVTAELEAALRDPEIDETVIREALFALDQDTPSIAVRRDTVTPPAS